MVGGDKKAGAAGRVRRRRGADVMHAPHCCASATEGFEGLRGFCFDPRMKEVPAAQAQPVFRRGLRGFLSARVYNNGVRGKNPF